MTPTTFFKKLPLVIAGLVALCGSAHADFVTSLGTISAPASVAFSNSAVTPGTVNGVYNFFDQFSFTLDPAANISAIAAAINFTDALGNVVLGVSNLQLRLTSPTQTLVAWQTASMPAPGLSQVISVIPTTFMSAGTYSIDIRGTVVQPGSYSGSLIASVVPLPASLPLLLAGVTFIGGLARRHVGKNEA